jgi:hypothetical protein
MGFRVKTQCCRKEASRSHAHVEYTILIRTGAFDLEDACKSVHISSYVLHHFVEMLSCLVIGVIGGSTLLFKEPVAFWVIPPLL